MELFAKQIHIESGSALLAKGGEITVTATAHASHLTDPVLNPKLGNPSAADLTDSFGRDPDVKVQIESGVRIDVSGYDETLPMSRNIIDVELQGSQLQDAPLQRDGILKGKTVQVDVRQGTPLTDITPFAANVPKSFRERNGAGGTVKISSEGEIRILAGAQIDVSGGPVTYEGGALPATKLLA